MDLYTASDILSRLGIPRGEDFHRLPASTVERLLDEADQVKYRRPRYANGSRGRYFHAFLQRVAARRDH
jgi:hypothetical protein